MIFMKPIVVVEKWLPKSKKKKVNKSLKQKNEIINEIIINNKKHTNKCK